MKFLVGMLVGLSATQLHAQTAGDSAAIRVLIREEDAAWSRGDAVAYSRSFAEDGTFTNIAGQHFAGHAAFEAQHARIFQSIYKGTTLAQELVSLQFLSPEVAVAETLVSLSGITQPLPGGVALDAEGRLRTLLLQVFARRSGEWMIVSYHNVVIRPGVALPATIR